jgi:alkylation response protein AidB-like acyl-CoA dehydrogenase
MSYYENVRVPDSMIVGGLNNGWRLITTQLNHERIGLAAFGGIAFSHLENVTAWAREKQSEDGARVVDNSRVQTALGEASARLDAMKVMNWRMAAALENDILDPALASAVKVYSTETLIEVYRLLQEVLGVSGALRAGSAGAVLQGALSQEARACQINTFGGGVNEVQREIVAMAGLRMPRAPR